MNEDLAPEAMPSVQLSPIVRAANHRIAHNALYNLTDGELQLVLKDYMLNRYGAQRGAFALMMIAKEVEAAPWPGDLRK